MRSKEAYCPACGYVLRKPRSLKAHRLFFAVIEAAFDNWPHDHPEIEPKGREHLRAWLLCKAGYCHTIGERLNQDDGDVQRMVQFMEAVNNRMIAEGVQYFFRDIYKQNIVAYVPRSIAWSELDERDFAQVREAVFHQIETHTHLKIEELQNHERKNARRDRRPAAGPGR